MENFDVYVNSKPKPMNANIAPNSRDKVLQDAIDELEAGNCIALPTETVYGLAADATNGEAVAKIFQIKQRPSFNPLICHVSDIKMAEHFGQFTPLALKLANAFWPGPLTLVVEQLPASGIHPLVSAGLGTIGIRIPQGIASDIIGAFGKPLAAPSANRSGRISPTRAEHVHAEFPDEPLLVIDNGPSRVGLESTILKVENDGQLTLLRPGSVTVDDIAACTGVTPLAFEGSDVQAPGMMQSHYAPDAHVRLNCTEYPDNAAWLQFGNAPEQANALNLSAQGNLVEAAANLYDFLKQLDALEVDLICVSPIPETGLGLAINDRLRRAAAPRG